MCEWKVFDWCEEEVGIINNKYMQVVLLFLNSEFCLRLNTAQFKYLKDLKCKYLSCNVELCGTSDFSSCMLYVRLVCLVVFFAGGAHIGDCK